MLSAWSKTALAVLKVELKHSTPRFYSFRLTVNCDVKSKSDKTVFMSD
jgi:hypothetical protein